MASATSGAVGLTAALTYLTKNAIEAGEANEEFAAKTSIAREAVEPLKEAIHVAGGSLDQFGNLLFMMQRRMTEGGAVTDTFEKGLNRVGLTLQNLANLSPDQQLLKISTAFRDNTDASNRAATAFDLFSRAGRDAIPVLMKPLAELTDQMREAGHVMSAEDTQAATELAMAWRGLKESISWTVTETGIGVIHFFKDLATAANAAVYVVDPLAQDVAVAAARLSGELPKVRDNIESLLPAAARAKGGVEILATAEKELTKSAEESIRIHLEEIKMWDEYNAIGRNVFDTIDKVSGATVEAIKYDLQRGVSQELLVKVYGVAREQIHAISEEEKFLVSVTTATTKVFHELHDVALVLLPAGLPERTAAFRRELERLTSATNEFHGGITIAGDQMQTTTIPMFATLPNVIAKNSEAIRKARFDTDDWDGRLNELTKDFEHLGRVAHGTLGGLARDVAITIDTIKLGKDSVKDFTAGLDAYKSGDKSGGLMGIASGLGGIASAASVAIAGVKALVSFIKGIGGPSADEVAGRKVEADFEKQFGGFQKMMDAIGKAYADTGKSAAQAQADVLAMMNAEKMGAVATKAAIENINAALNEQKQDAADLDAAIKKYGFSIAELGPTMRRQELTKQAVALENDFRLLAGSGIDVNLVLQKMGGSINDFLHLAQKTGSEVPAEMQPILQKMIDLGTLTDSSGNAITDMKDIGVVFSETMTQGFQKVVDKLQQLLDRIGMVPAALNSIPTERTVQIHFNVDSFPDMPNIPTFGPEVFVPRPRLAVVGTGGGEVVLHKDTFDTLMHGGGADMSGVLDELGGIREELARQRQLLPMAVRDAVQRA